MKLHHVGIAVDDLKSSIPRHKATFNLRQITEIVTDPVQKVKVVLLSGGEQRRVLIELIAPLGERSPISKILERENHLYHICFEVDNIDRALQVARRQGAIIVSEPVEAKLYNGKRIAFVYTRDRYLVEFMEK